MLETARVLTSTKERSGDVIALFTDGEEAGLWGAEAFVSSHPLGPSVGLVLNVDARGTSGPSLLFETSADAAGGLSYASHPVTSSLFPMVYERLANGTDFTRFRAKGVLGLNYASLGSSSRYHTSHDDGASFSNASLQDHGDNVALAATRFAGGAAPSADGPRVFFGVLRIGLVAWPHRGHRSARDRLSPDGDRLDLRGAETNPCTPHRNRGRRHLTRDGGLLGPRDGRRSIRLRCAFLRHGGPLRHARGRCIDRDSGRRHAHRTR